MKDKGWGRSIETYSKVDLQRSWGKEKKCALCGETFKSKYGAKYCQLCKADAIDLNKKACKERSKKIRLLQGCS